MPPSGVRSRFTLGGAAESAAANTPKQANVGVGKNRFIFPYPALAIVPGGVRVLSEYYIERHVAAHLLESLRRIGREQCLEALRNRRTLARIASESAHAIHIEGRRRAVGVEARRGVLVSDIGIVLHQRVGRNTRLRPFISFPDVVGAASELAVGRHPVE